MGVRTLNSQSARLADENSLYFLTFFSLVARTFSLKFFCDPGEGQDSEFDDKSNEIIAATHGTELTSNVCRTDGETELNNSRLKLTLISTHRQQAEITLLKSRSIRRFVNKSYLPPHNEPGHTTPSRDQEYT